MFERWEFPSSSTTSPSRVFVEGSSWVSPPRLELAGYVVCPHWRYLAGWIRIMAVTLEQSSVAVIYFYGPSWAIQPSCLCKPYHSPCCSFCFGKCQPFCVCWCFWLGYFLSIYKTFFQFDKAYLSWEYSHCWDETSCWDKTSQPSSTLRYLGGLFFMIASTSSQSISISPVTGAEVSLGF